MTQLIFGCPSWFYLYKINIQPVDLDQCEWRTLTLTHSTADNLQLLSPPLELTLSGGLARAQRRGGAGGPGRALLQAAAHLFGHRYYHVGR